MKTHEPGNGRTRRQSAKKAKTWVRSLGDLGEAKFTSTKGDSSEMAADMATPAASESIAASGGIGVAAPSGARAGRGRSKAMKPASPAKKRMGRRQHQVAAGLLTAGSFDDRLNLDRFLDYWQGGSLAKRQLVKSADFEKKTNAWSRGYDALQLAFVVDVTGSMGDELNYLKTEFANIVATVDRDYPGVKKESR